MHRHIKRQKEYVKAMGSRVSPGVGHLWSFNDFEQLTGTVRPSMAFTGLLESVLGNFFCFGRILQQFHYLLGDPVT